VYVGVVACIIDTCRVTTKVCLTYTLHTSEEQILAHIEANNIIMTNSMVIYKEIVCKALKTAIHV
jgi:hypothetical protein